MIKFLIKSTTNKFKIHITKLNIGLNTYIDIFC